MLQFQKIRIKNFQCWGKLQIKFGRITSIVGSSDCGKSAIIRALRWVLLNQSNGLSDIKEGAKESSVELFVSNGPGNYHGIKRRRSKRLNVYQTDYEQEFAAVGTKVPEDLEMLFAVSDVNLQQQHKAYFWLDESAGQVAKNLNEVIDLQSIDKMTDRANKVIRATEADRKLTKGRLDEAELDLENWLWAEEFSADVEALQDKNRLHRQAARIEATLSRKIEELVRGSKKLEKATQARLAADSARKQVKQLEALAETSKKANEAHQSLSKLVKSLDRQTTCLNVLTSELKDSNDLLNEFESCPVCGSLKK